MKAATYVHKNAAPARVSRGVRMDRRLWEFVDRLAPGDSSRLIESWVREKRDVVVPERKDA